MDFAKYSMLWASIGVDMNAELDGESLLHHDEARAGGLVEQDSGAVDVIWSWQRIGIILRLVYEQDIVWRCLGHDEYRPK